MNPLRILFPEIRVRCNPVVLVAGLAFAGVAHAQSVQWGPFADSVDGLMPLSGSVLTTLYAPSSVTSSQTVAFNIQGTTPAATLASVGVTAAQTVSWVTISPSPVVFNSSVRSQTLTISLNMPSFAGVPPGTKLLFSWQIKTTGWTTAVSDSGYALNASVTVPPPPSNQPPVVTITSPLDGTNFTYQATQVPTTIPLTFQATTASPLTINAIDATLTGPGTTGQELIVTPSGIGTQLATGTASMPIPAAGTYKITAHGFNGIGAATATSNFTVTVVGVAPVVTINQPAPGDTFQVPLGSPTVHVPFDFTAVSSVGVLRTVTVAIDGAAASYTTTSGGLNTNSLAGTAPIDLGVTAVGRHTITVTGTNDYGTATTDTYYFITAVSVAPVVDVLTPADGTQIQVASLPVTVAFTYQGSVPATTGSIQPPITAVSSQLDDGTVFTPSITGLNTAAVTGGGSVLVTTAGSHAIYTTVTNSVGSATDSNSFTIKIVTPPPTAKITSPTSGTTYTYYTGKTQVSVPFNFGAHSYAASGITTLVATVDGVDVSPLAGFTLGGLNTADATGSVTLPYTTAGVHTLMITATDEIGTATDTSQFTVNVVSPTINIAISQPLNGAVFNIPSGYFTTSTPFSFTATTNSPFTIDSVSAQLGTSAATISSTSGAGTASETASGTLNNLAPGTYTLTATGIASGQSASTSVTFTVNNYAVILPLVVINSPANGATFNRAAGVPTLTIPLTFTGTSRMVNGTIKTMTASLTAPGGTTTNLGPVTVTPSTTNPASATGTTAMTVSAAGTYTISVGIIDSYGLQASTTGTFVVTVETTKTVTGSVFFDANLNGAFDSLEFGLAAIPVKLTNGSGVTVGSAVTGPDGSYAITGVPAGTYSVVATPGAGLRVTTSPASPTIIVPVASTTYAAPAIGLGLDFKSIQGMIANGYTIGFWKNNLDKAIAKKSTGTQVSAAQCTAYTTAIASLALSPYDKATMKQLSTIMGSTSSAPVDLLSKQLVASEFNYENGAYLNGNRTLTFLFIWWGEYALSHPSQYSSSAYSSSNLIWVKDWFDAYNNSHGGAVSGPLP